MISTVVATLFDCKKCFQIEWYFNTADHPIGFKQSTFCTINIYNKEEVDICQIFLDLCQSITCTLIGASTCHSHFGVYKKVKYPLFTGYGLAINYF